VYLVSADDGWIVGADLKVAVRDWYKCGVILRWNGSEWMKLEGIEAPFLDSIYMVSPTEGWAVGDGILRYGKSENLGNLNPYLVGLIVVVCLFVAIFIKRHRRAEKFDVW
jgi:hypothetical protein